MLKENGCVMLMYNKNLVVNLNSPLRTLHGGQEKWRRRDGSPVFQHREWVLKKNTDINHIDQCWSRFGLLERLQVTAVIYNYTVLLLLD